MHRSPVRCPPSTRHTAPAAPIDLAAWRHRHERAVRRAAAAPVRYVPAAFLDALQGSWSGLEPVEAAALELVRRVSAR